MTKKTNESGRSFVEVLGVIGVLAVMTVGAITGLSYVMTLFRISQTQAEIEEISHGVYELYAWNRNIPTDLMPTICSNDIISKKCIVASSLESDETTNTEGITGSEALLPKGEYWTNSFGGTIEVVPFPENNPETFVIRYTQLPKMVCQQLGCSGTDSWIQVVVHKVHETENSQENPFNETNCPCVDGSDNVVEFKPKLLEEV